MNKLILIMIPTYNEEHVIYQTLKQLLNDFNIYGYTKKIIIIDSSSIDNTIMMIQKIKSNNIIILNENKKNGIGSAYKMGLKLCNKYNPYAIITFDSDGQHDINFINKSIKLLDKYDYINASRFLPDSKIVDYTYNRKTIFKTLNYIYNLKNLTKITDLSSGLQCIKYEIIKNINIDLLSNNFEFQIDIKKQICSITDNIYELPITFYSRNNGESKNNYNLIQIIKYIINFIK